jgi:hypothetical protein
MVQYIDYTYWNRALLSQEYVRDSLEFWRWSLGCTGIPLEFMDLPLDRPWPPQFLFDGETVQGSLTAAALHSVLHCRAALKKNAFDAILGGLTVLFSRLCS